ncbi:MAG: hypothetical protein K9L66_11860 [Spirochaetaceae bacterium]|nr:hypothetical protein [Spirochaetaceae bacterium]MCF7949033.1 hypothetical protein [Spirochaetia bacterium]MCF7952198.1 hypothetical protein [Spirochaetaceae bacterium]
MRWRTWWAVVLLIGLLGVMPAGAQEVSEKKDIAVFNLSYSDYSIPSGALGLVDQSIQNVFIDLGRFNVLGMNYRLESNEIDEFINKIKELKQENVEIPEAVRLGEETFTEADFNKLVGSFIVVVPVISYYNVYQEGNDYEAELQTSFTFIKVDTAEAFASFQIDTSASGDNSRQAVKSAVDMIPIQLQYELRSIPEFQLKTGIVDIEGREIIIEFGRNMGVRVGDEYALTESRILSSGFTRTEESGLFVIKDVDEQISTATKIYSSKKPGIGDQMQEIPRLGVNAEVYAHVLQDNAPDGIENRFVIGLEATATRGYYDWRPIAGVEVPLGDNLFIWFPVISYVGMEYNLRLGRLSIAPSAAVGVGTMVPILGDEEFRESFEFLASFGGTAKLSVKYLFNRDMMLNLNAGYSAYIGLFPDIEYSTTSGPKTLTNPADVQGSFVGVGMTFKL